MTASAPPDYTPTLIAVAGTLFGALIGAISGYVIARQNRAEARRSRIVDRIIDLGSTMVIDADVHAREVAAAVARIREQARTAEPLTIPTVNETESVRRAGMALQIVAPKLSEDATTIYASIVNLDLATEPARLNPRRGMQAQEEADYRDALKDFDEARRTLLAALNNEVAR